MVTFGERLRQLREAKGLSQKALSLSSDEAQQSIARWEAGTHFPDVKAFAALCKALGATCTAFDGCEFAAAEEKRPRGRPAKEPTEPAPKGAAAGRENRDHFL